ncbi:unnamed protein product [Calicophoron daubneyi]|uniref:Uncharacterized protein n=1 Tax=Calicophoron daubneyi TaxID=300641 RepID=A0AAV2TKL8_CALDB
MSESPSTYLKRFLSDVDGIVGLYVSDKDGVLIASASAEDITDQITQPYILKAFISSIQQSNKLGMGGLEWMLTRYQDMMICQFNYSDNRLPFPLFLTVVGTPDCDLGSILAAEPFIRSLLARLGPQVVLRMQNEMMMCRNSEERSTLLLTG